MAIPKGQMDAGVINTTRQLRKYYMSEPFNIDSFISLATSHATQIADYEILMDYYRGNHIAIQRRQFDDTNKPNNRVVHNFPKAIVDASTAHLVGEAVSYSGHEATIEAMLPILKANFVDDVNMEESKLAAIMGHCFEIGWMKDVEGEEKAQWMFKQVSARNCFIAYSMDLEERPLAAIHYNNFTDVLTGGSVRVYEVYTKDKVYKFSSNTTKDGEELTQGSVRIYDNLLGMFQVTEILANEERLGDFEGQISLIDAYNLAVSDSINDINYWNDAYLWLQGFDLTSDDDVAAMKNDRIIITDDHGNIQFVTKDVNDAHIENIKNRAKEDIFTFSFTPDMMSKDFAGSTAVAMEVRSTPLFNKTAIKEAKMRKSMQQRFKLICKYLEVTGQAKEGTLKPLEVEPVFIRNTPQAFTELADMAVKMRDIMSDETILNQFPFVKNAMEEMDRVKKERKDRVAQGLPENGVAQNMLSKLKLDNNPANNTQTTVDPVAAKAQETAKNTQANN